jgi:hypothetical protein
MVEAPDFSQGSGVFRRRGAKGRSYVGFSPGPLCAGPPPSRAQGRRHQPEAPERVLREELSPPRHKTVVESPDRHLSGNRVNQDLGVHRTRNELQILVFIQLLLRDESSARNHWVRNQHSTAKFLHVPHCFGLIGVARHKLDLCEVSVEEYMVTLSYFLAGPVDWLA